MTIPADSLGGDAARLQHCLNDVVALTALPALWAGGGPARIAREVLDALGEMLAPAFVYLVLEDAPGIPAAEMACPGAPLDPSCTARQAGALLEQALGAAPSAWPASARVPLGGAEVHVACARLGLQGELGTIAAGCTRPGFPDGAERLLLDVAANQAAIGLRQARLLVEQEQLARSLDERVAERTRELAAADERLRDAAATLAASEHRLRLTIDTIPAMAWSARPDGSADFFNQHYLDFLGATEEQVSGWGWTGALHPDDVGGMAAMWRRITASDAPGEAEARLRRHDGAYRWFLFRASPLRDEHGGVLRWYGVNTDIEDRKRAEAELRRAHDSFAEAQRLSKTGSFITDLVGDDHNWSEETYRIFGFEPGSEVTVARIRDLIVPEDLPGFDGMIARAMTGENVAFAFRIVTERSGLKHIGGVAHVVERVEGRPMFVGALRDVTEQRVAEEALDRARSELAHVARVATLSTLAASIAHEVSQPLAGIVTNASTCLRMLDAVPPDLEGARATARRTIRDGHRASDVLTHLRTLFTKKEFTLDRVDLNEATREVIALSSGDLRRNRVMVRTELDPALPPVTGDRVQLQQVILNLVRNASESMAGVDDRPRELIVRTEREDGGGVRVTVRDSGVGIDPDHLGRLFDPFFSTKSDGMGIGLSVSRSIIDRHRGRLWAEPHDGPGSTFVVSVPSAAES